MSANTFEKYAEAVRSGRAQQMGDTEVMADNQWAPLPKRDEPNNLLKAVVVLVMLVLLAWASIVSYKLYKTGEVDVIVYDLKAEFMKWAYAQSTGLGLDCHSLTIKNKKQVILHNCTFNTISEREARINTTPL